MDDRSILRFIFSFLCIQVSMSSSDQTPHYTHKSSPGTPFAYQARLLERTSSNGGSSRSSRNNSQSGPGVHVTPIGSSNTFLGSRRRAAPSHRPSSSLDVLRGKWEERVREVEAEEHSLGNYNSMPDTLRSGSQSSALGSITLNTTSNPISSNNGPFTMETAMHLKRRTMPDPIITLPFSPNTIAEIDTPSSTSPRPHIPSSTVIPSPKHPVLLSTSQKIFPPSSSRSIYEMPRTSNVRQSSPLRNHKSLSSHPSSTNSPDSSPDIRPVVAQHSHHVFSLSQATSPVDTPRNRSQSLHESSILSTPEKSAKQSLYTLGRNKSVTSLTYDQGSTKVFATTPSSESDEKWSNLSQLSLTTPIGCSSPSVLSSVPYKSSYMSSKRASAHDKPISNRRDHFPRVASGDSDESWEEGKAAFIQDPKSIREDVNRVSTRKGQLKQDLYAKTPASLFHSQSVPEIPGFAIPESDGVAGLPGRLQLKAPSGHAASNLSTRYHGRNWADTQRHLIQAYEYLCHVGEAHQWIEGCIGEEIGFNILEMEEGLRNGVVLAKLVRAFHPQAVRRIFEV